ncbi:MAG: hypothetical protein IPJ61_05025 [Tessaracoccus sp.]|uniref:hypothetical protein n=1 Tax=Tessaracoccus sp. TaxID=1971211 RepID=UPI001EBF52FA|nr:hypothetical protein [Tessaracoccus sp.]MBK7820438.1 hypothetical protein [Tessaracoccus sp.]
MASSQHQEAHHEPESRRRTRPADTSGTAHATDTTGTAHAAGSARWDQPANPARWVQPSDAAGSPDAAEPAR